MTPVTWVARERDSLARVARALQCGLLLLMLALWGCSCRSSPALATLNDKAGTVERDYGDKPRAWQAASVGAEFRLGDGVQTLADSSATLALDDGAQLALRANTLIRFSSTPPKERALAFDVEIGSAELSSATVALSLGTASGLVRLEPASRVTLSRDAGGLRFVVQVGQAVLGDVMRLSVGEAVLIDAAGTRTPLHQAAAPGEPSEPAPVEAAAPGGDVTAVVRGKGASIRTEEGRRRLPQGASQLTPGTELELEQSTQVELKRGNQSATLDQNGRYLIAPKPDVLVKATSGSLSAGGAERVRVEVPGGVIVVAPRGMVNVQVRRKGEARVAVQARDAVLQTERGSETLSAGEEASLAVDGRISVQGRSLEYADLELAAGESVVIHDPGPPTAVRFLFADACPERGVVQLSGGSFAAGSGAVSMAMKPGQHRYELRCESSRSSVVRRGRVSVVKDGGTRAMATHPPSTALQADGRNYTVLYQNRLPKITLTWPSPPASGDVTLVHENSGKLEQLKLSAPSHTFASGRLEEGKHMFHFVGGGKISRQTSLSILFDNAAPTAFLNTPVKVLARSGEALTVSGTALPGWEVRVEGEPAQRDAQGRFSQATVMPSERRAVVIRISHPERGTHVYLRRSTS